ncbi:MAG: hypothetical protein ACREN6_16830 [Gemmatimonadaceae bacterium]
MRNTGSVSNTLISRAVAVLRERLPAGWEVKIRLEPRGRASAVRPDAVLELTGPDGRRAAIVVEAKTRVTAAVASAAAPQLERAVRTLRAAGGLLVTDYLSPLARQRLADGGASYLDLTGNARVVVSRPAIVIESRGADRDPTPEGREVRSLKGGSAARIVRALCDWTPPVGVRALARRAEVNPGYATRVLALLEKEDVVSRDPGGAVAAVRWNDLLRRWTQDYAVTTTNRTVSYLEPRSIDALAKRLDRYKGRWALTGSRAVPPAAAAAPARTLSCYVESADAAATALGLRSVDGGANVVLIEPFDAVVWQRTRTAAGLTCVAISQCAADLLTGPGREPAEGDALLAWMERNESAWRA